MNSPVYETALSEIEDYLFCSLLHYWKHVHPHPQVKNLNTTLDLPKLAISSALSLWASRSYPDQSIEQLTHSVWEAWFKHYQVSPDSVAMLKLFAERRRDVLKPFLQGKIRNPSGGKYVEPRMTRRYKDMMSSAGLDILPQRVEEHVSEAFEAAGAELAGLGPYRVADAYADSLLMAEQYKPPVVEAIVGVDVPVEFEMQGVVVKATADLVMRSENGPVVEIHDYDPKFYFSQKWVAKSPRLIAAGQFRSEAVGLEHVQRVVYRHFMSGQTTERKVTRSSRLAMALIMAGRGIEAGFVVPAFFSGLDRCKRCPLSEHCLGESEDVIEHFYPGLLAMGESVSTQEEAAISGVFDGSASFARNQYRLQAEAAANRGKK